MSRPSWCQFLTVVVHTPRQVGGSLQADQPAGGEAVASGSQAVVDSDVVDHAGVECFAGPGHGCRPG